MNIRIIAGRYGGRKIEAPDNRRTHPMGERIRNALFNKIGEEIAEASVLDAFAGTGSVGLEALSRGAAKVTFIEKDRIAHKILVNNTVSLGVENQVNAVRAGVSPWLVNNPAERFDIIFADPPYHDIQLSTVKMLMDYLKPNGLMVLSHPGRGELPTKTGVVVVDNRSYGNAVLTFYRREDS